MHAEYSTHLSIIIVYYTMKAVYMFAYADKYAYYVSILIGVAIYPIDCDDVLNYSPTIHTLANLEQLLTDSMTPMLDVKLDHRHCSSPKCPTICRLGQYVPVAILSCIVASFMNIAH